MLKHKTMKKSKLNIEYWFPTPIWNYKFNDINTDQLNEAIKFCYEVKKNNPGRVKSNAGGWQSYNLRYNYIEKTPLLPFFNEILPLLDELVIEVASPGALKLPNDVWININKKGDKNLLHYHPNSAFSGVFYLTDKNSKIKFVKNNDISSWWRDCMESKRDTPSTFNEVEYTPRAGDLFLFPAWLHHFVDEHEYDSERISVAFNIQYD
jgi:uncharacterized protein (TIGR02466 family)